MLSEVQNGTRCYTKCITCAQHAAMPHQTLLKIKKKKKKNKKLTGMKRNELYQQHK